MGSLSMLMSGLGTASVYALVDEGLRKPATFVGVRASMQGAGSIAGGLLAGRILNRRSERILAASGALLLGAGMMVTCVPWTPASLASAGIIGIGLPWTIIAAMTAVQRHTPTALLGRVAGTATSLVFAPPAVAIPLGAGLLTVVDYRIPLVAGAAGSLLAGCYALRANRGLPLKPNLTTLNQRRPVDGD